VTALVCSPVTALIVFSIKIGITVEDLSILMRDVRIFEGITPAGGMI